MFDRRLSYTALLFSWIPCVVSAEEVFYGNQAVGLEIRADTSTLVLFPAPPLSVNCQPANIVQFEAIDAASLTAVEAGYVTVEEKPEDGVEENPKVKRMIRLSPQGKKSRTKCTFSLVNGSQVSVKFTLRPDITRPFIEFRPLAERNSNITDPTRNLALEALKSSIGGDPVYFLQEERPFFGYRSSKSSSFATYKVVYKGTNGSSLTLWKVEGKVKADKTRYEDLAVLKVPSGAVFYSAMIPEKADFWSNEPFLIHIVGSNSLTGEEVLKSLR